MADHRALDYSAPNFSYRMMCFHLLFEFDTFNDYPEDGEVGVWTMRPVHGVSLFFAVGLFPIRLLIISLSLSLSLSLSASASTAQGSREQSNLKDLADFLWKI
jgi:hypothetical protein